MTTHKLLTAVLCCMSLISIGQDLSQLDSYMLDAQYAKAIDYIDGKLPGSAERERIILLNKKAESLIRLGKLDEAGIIVDDLTTQNIAGDLQALTLTTQGALALNRGRSDNALDLFRKALEILEQNGRQSSIEAADVLAYLGQVYKFTGKDIQAQEQLLRALTIRQQHLPENHELVAASYNDLGLAYIGTDNDRSLDYYERAQKIYESLHGADHPKLAIANVNTGFAYRELKLYGDAVNNLERALAIWEKTFEGPHPSKAFALQNLGSTYVRMNNPTAAKGYYERSLKMYRDVYGASHPEIAQVLNQMGNLEISAGRYQQGLQYFDEAIRANIKEPVSGSEKSKFQNYYNGNVLLYSLLFQAEALEKRYLGHSLKFSDLTGSLSKLSDCDHLIEQLRKGITNENDKIALGVIANQVYADGVRIAVEAARNAVKKKRWYELAFYFAEKSKSAVLLEAIADADAKSFAGIPPALMEEERQLKSDMALLAQKLSQKPDAEEEKKLRDHAFNVNRQYEAFTARLEKEFPEYYNLKFNTTHPSVQQLNAVIKEGTAVLSYFLDDSNARLYIFTVTRNNMTVTERQLPVTFDKYITGFRNSIFFNDEKTYLKTASELSRLIIPPLRRDINGLVIIPTGRLSVIPFEALLSHKSVKESTFASMPYLVKDYSLQYEFAASLLIQKHDQAPAGRSILLYAPVSFKPDDKLSDLPGTESEISSIAEMFKSKSFDARVALHETASETSLKNQQLENYSHLHFATHGIVDANRPELSRIYLSDEGGADDGYLFSGEIYNLNLNADLVALSACQTGLGKISKGEGVIGLSRALVYAGARNIIVSFWSVSDESTSTLMKTFYQRYLDSKKSYAVCMRDAKIALMGEKQYASPYYWAPFILIGHE